MTSPIVTHEARAGLAAESSPASIRARAKLAQLGWALLAALFLLIVGVHRAAAEENILFNGDLSKGAGDSPERWRSDAWQNGPDFSAYSWRHTGNKAGEVEVVNAKPNDARWTQSVHLGPGWYHFTASIRSEDVLEDNTGVNLSILEDGIISQQLHGTHDWQPVGFYLKIGASSADLIVACRLGGYASLNTGRAFCRDLRAVKVNEPPQDDSPKYDLDVIRNGGTPPPPPPSSDNSMQVAILFLAALVVLIALFGSRRYGKGALQKVRLALAAAAADRPMAPGRLDRSRREIEIALFLVCLLSFAYFYQASDHSTASRFDLIRSILENHSLSIDRFAGYNTADIVQLRSHIYSNKAPGGALTGLLPWALVTGILGFFLSPPSALYWAFATYLTTIFSVSLISAMLAVLVYRFALMLGAGSGRAVALALTLSFATIMFPHATEFTSEPIAAFSTFAAFYVLALPQDDEPWWWGVIPGLLAGWGVLCDYPTLLLAVGVGGYAVWRLRDWRRILPFAVGALAVACLLMLYDRAAFGNPFFVSYEAYMLPGSDRFPEQAAGFAGVTYPRLPILWDVLIDPQRGLFFCNPVLLLVIPGLFYFWRQKALRPEFAVVLFAVVSFTLLNGSYGNSIIYWGGGTATGPRHIVPALPFMVLAIAFLPAKLDAILAALAVVSTFFMLMATAIEPHLPYEYLNPFRDFVWPAYFRGDLAYNKSTYFGGPPIAGDSVAFNLGKLIGLPGWMQLWPLGAFWAGFAIYLLDKSGSSPLPASSARIVKAGAVFAIVALIAPPTLGALTGAPNRDPSHGLLGCYYEGLRPNGFPPHIRRVDEQINFDHIAELGALPSPSCVIWSGKILAPLNGLYRFAITADDSGWLKIDGRTVIADPGDITKPLGNGSMSLTPGLHSIEVGQRNIWGEASIHLLWQKPDGASGVVPSQFLVPDSSCRQG